MLQSIKGPALDELDESWDVTTLIENRKNRNPYGYIAEWKEEYQSKGAESWNKITAQEFYKKIMNVAGYLIEQKVKPGDRVAIWAETGIYWTILDCAIMAVGAVVVPIYQSDSQKQIKFIRKDSQVDFVFYQKSFIKDDFDIKKILGKKTYDIKKILNNEIDDYGYTFKNKIMMRRNKLNFNSLATIVYTSGTTGNPKGVELTHGNIIALTQSVLRDKSSDSLLPVIGDADARLLMFLPLAHIFARTVNFIVLASDATLGFSTPEKFIADAGNFKPTVIIAVPRVLEKVIEGIEAKAGGGIKLKLTRAAEKTARVHSKLIDGISEKRFQKIKYGFFEKLIFEKIYELLGEDCKYLVSGGAPLDESVSRFFHGLKLTFLTGWGMTQTSGAAMVTRPVDNKVGSIGKLLPGYEVKILPNSESIQALEINPSGFVNAIDFPDEQVWVGEIAIKGPGIFKKYHNRAQDKLDSGEFLDDGFIATGDIGWISKNGHVHIVGRCKEIIVTAGGKNVSPSPMEQMLNQHNLVSNSLVVGNDKKHIAALVVLKSGVEPSSENLDAISRWIKNKVNSTVSKAESIRRFVILDEDFTEENGLMTPSMKVKRLKATEKYADLIDQLYTDNPIGISI